MSVARKNEIMGMSQLAEFISDIIQKESGNILDITKQSMVVSRLQKRMLDLGEMSSDEYYEHFQNNKKEETNYLVSLLTTHHTFFFREFIHFEFIKDHLGELVEKAKARGDKTLKIYSAGCSRGHEIYSLAMFFEHHLKDYPGMNFEIHGSDIDPKSIDIAKNGVYLYKEVKTIPQIYLSGNWQRGTGEIAHFARVKPHLKKKCFFSTLNLLDNDYKMSGKKFDLILCRNVFIYFKQDHIKQIVENLKKNLHQKGYFISGISESLNSLEIPKKSIAPSVYSFDPAVIEAKSEVVKVKPLAASQIETKNEVKKKIKVLCVDDSKAVLKLITKIFQKDPDFEVVGTAENGIQAQDFLKINPDVDAMTLDIHMPEMDGVTYLQKNFGPHHPKVVVVSSASREDTTYAQKTLQYGASDFVEKPAMNNLAYRADEIKSKVKMAMLNDNMKVDEVDHAFANDFKIEDIDKKARMFVGNISDLEKIKKTVEWYKGDNPPTFFFFEGNQNFLEMIKQEFPIKMRPEEYKSGMEVQKNHFYIADFGKSYDEIMQSYNFKSASIGIFGFVTKMLREKVKKSEKIQVMVDECNSNDSSLTSFADDVFPWTSFAHLGTEFLSKK